MVVHSRPQVIHKASKATQVCTFGMPAVDSYLCEEHCNSGIKHKTIAGQRMKLGSIECTDREKLLMGAGNKLHLRCGRHCEKPFGIDQDRLRDEAIWRTSTARLLRCRLRHSSEATSAESLAMTCNLLCAPHSYP